MSVIGDKISALSKDSDAFWFKKLASLRGGKKDWVGWKLDPVLDASIRTIWTDLHAVPPLEFGKIPIPRKENLFEADDAVVMANRLSGMLTQAIKITMRITGKTFNEEKFNAQIFSKNSDKWRVSCPFDNCNKLFTFSPYGGGRFSSRGLEKHLSASHKVCFRFFLLVNFLKIFYIEFSLLFWHNSCTEAPAFTHY